MPGLFLATPSFHVSSSDTEHQVPCSHLCIPPSPCREHVSFSYSPVSYTFYDFAQVLSVTEPQVVSPVSYHIVLHVFLYGPGPCSALGNPGHIAAQWLTQEGDYLFSVYWMEQNFLLPCFSGTLCKDSLIVLFFSVPFVGDFHP